MFGQLKQIYARRELIYYFVSRDLKVAYSHKIMGYAWSLLDPLALMVIYTILVQYIFERGGPLYPVMILSSLLAWRWFVSSTAASVVSFTTKARIIKTVDFPRAVLPISRIISNLVQFLLGLLVLVPMLILYDVPFTWNVLWLPVIIAVQLTFTTGICLLCAIGGVFFRDLQNIMQFTLRIWFYASPVLYTVDRIPESARTMYRLNPFASLFESYRNVLIKGTGPDEFLFTAFLMSLAIAFLGFTVCGRIESRVAKEL